ncbi:hypothetical protein ALO83_103901 [Pseudomonas cannabina pv. alisalensis]|uniref:Uncharacterized protein n=1 Tax=Pseudomonas cannabina TaxID=86840 RepID=A0A3M3QAN2_PSECA|nr:hypothetical protein ALO83_103901 [Pseudomonas cannabina pv. alisalensis]RMN79107.1 hypothetical protein ALQ52_104611 [Pseudomonas cannabina pv. alisalensis]RMN81266.1 hypothetical protein ALQ53_103640 [Pseudomonas cannabina]RMN97480.1 hypothetical protein ALQ51_102264 [Pseudomonas cannabina]
MICCAAIGSFAKSQHDSFSIGYRRCTFSNRSSEIKITGYPAVQ